MDRWAGKNIECMEVDRTWTRLTASKGSAKNIKLAEESPFKTLHNFLFEFVLFFSLCEPSICYHSNPL